jgi:hypothetical protein
MFARRYAKQLRPLDKRNAQFEESDSPQKISLNANDTIEAKIDSLEW